MAKHSFRDPDTDALKAWGYIDSNAPGDLMREEADDFTLAPGAWYWTGSAWAVYTPPPAPDVEGFMATLKASMTLVAANTFFAQYPLAFQALAQGGWADFQELVIHAHDVVDIDDTLYNVVRDAAIACALPLELPALP